MHDLTFLNTYRLKSSANTVVFPKTIKEIQNIIKLNRKLIIIGNGSNIILNKSFYDDEQFIFLKKNFSYTKFIGKRLIVDAGATLKDISVKALELSLSGMEVFYDIPATVGGAIYMNAGAYNESIYDNLIKVQCINKTTGKLKTYHKDEINHSYRYSLFQNNKEIILNAEFLLEKSDPIKIKNKLEHIVAIRTQRLPKNHPNAGSVFKRPNYSLSVGEMLEKINLKGYSIGDAEISTLHGGFILNKGSATADDILNLIKFIKNAIKKEYAIELQLEQIII